MKNLAKVFKLGLIFSIGILSNIAFACTEDKLKDPENYLIWSCFDGMAKVMVLTNNKPKLADSAGKVGFIDETGNIAIPTIYDDAHYFEFGMVGVRKKDNWGFIDKTGKVVVDFQYDYVWGFTEDLIAVSKNGKWGFIDKTGKEVISLMFDEVAGFYEGYSAVRIGEHWGYVNKNNEIVIDLIYEKVSSYENGTSFVKLNGEDFMIDKQGNRMFD